MSYNHILVAVDLSPSSQAVIDKAISLAKDAKSTLSLVYVNVDSVVLTPTEEAGLQKKLEMLAEQSDYPVKESLVVLGDLHIKLAGIVKSNGIDLVVCGHHHKLMSRLFSSVPKLANAVETDLLVVYLDK